MKNTLILKNSTLSLLSFLVMISAISCGPSKEEMQKAEENRLRKKYDSTEAHILKVDRLIMKEAADLIKSLQVIDSTHLSIKTGPLDIPPGEIWMFSECRENPSLKNLPQEVETFDCPEVLNNDNQVFYPNLVLNGKCKFLKLYAQVHNHSTFETGVYSVGSSIELRYIAGGSAIAVPSHYTLYDYTIVCYMPNQPLYDSLRTHIREALSWKQDLYMKQNFSQHFFAYDDEINSLMAILNTQSFNSYEWTP